MSLRRTLRNLVKPVRDRARAEWIRRFRSFTPEQFAGLLREIGIQKGDIILVHSAYGRFEGFTGGMSDTIRVLQESVGEDGGLLMPTIPFSSSAVEYARSGKITDLKRSPSQVGFLTEIFRRLPGVIRSAHPTHPVAVWGKRGHALLGRDWESRTPCGRGTVFHRLYEEGGSNVMLGCGIQPMTFYHCVEEMIESKLPQSPFTREEFRFTTRTQSGEELASCMRLFESSVGKRRILKPLEAELRATGKLHEGRLQGLEAIRATAPDVVSALEAMAGRGQHCYIG